MVVSSPTSTSHSFAFVSSLKTPSWCRLFSCRGARICPVRNFVSNHHLKSSAAAVAPRFESFMVDALGCCIFILPPLAARSSTFKHGKNRAVIVPVVRRLGCAPSQSHVRCSTCLLLIHLFFCNSGVLPYDSCGPNVRKKRRLTSVLLAT